MIGLQHTGLSRPEWCRGEFLSQLFKVQRYYKILKCEKHLPHFVINLGVVIEFVMWEV